MISSKTASITTLTTLALILRLWELLASRRKKQFSAVCVLMLLSSLLEVVSLGATIPFLTVLTSPEYLYDHELMMPIISIFNLNEPADLTVPLTIIFIAAAIIAGLVRIILLYIMTRFSYAVGADIGHNIYRRTLYQNYLFHCSRNSSEIINGIVVQTHTVINSVLTPIMQFISSAILLIGLGATLFYIDTYISTSAFIGLGLTYWVITRLSRNQLKESSQSVSDESKMVVKSLQEGLGGIRDVLIDGNQEFYSKIFRNADLRLRRAQGNIVFISGYPRYAMEAIGMSLIAILAFVMVRQSDNIANIIPILGALALGAQRLLPAMQQCYSAVSSIRGSHDSVKDILSLWTLHIDEKMIKNNDAPMPFNCSIKLDNVSFRYSDNLSWVLEDVNLNIVKGSVIGFIGPTGSGKSTLIDIILGLLQPSKGSMYIDDKVIERSNSRLWQSNISHVPQNVHLFDGTISQNIALGIDKEAIDSVELHNSATKAQILGVINKMEERFQSKVGENGIRLSGGQRQRIGIARALYKDNDVLVLDEATSALDSKTEDRVMSAIESNNSKKTILIIAHRLSTLQECDKIVEFSEDGKVTIGTYDELIAK
jgi:ATP-binding cassette, subfamily B, bacterial PglK